jgi:hypothetical protein
MPFNSSKQRRFMHAKHPEIANRWEREAKASGTAAVQPGAKHPRQSMHELKRAAGKR